ncbi:MAG: FAD-dependent thymidylate synthase [Oscillospiraceae bacterium]|nr:FAD-dependent thymidylate synthase [Oscillospiraceae bacterium]
MISNLSVEILSHTPEPEVTVASAAKLCYSPSKIKEIREKCSPQTAASFIRMLSSMGHQSPFEHASFTFGIEGVSRILLAQLTRHRMASYSVQSQRYVKETGFAFVIPPDIFQQEAALSEFNLALKTARESYEKIVSILKKVHTENSISKGIERSKAESVAEKRSIEDARYLLPGGIETKIICTFNARSLINFFSNRCCNRAQWEIRTLAEKMLECVIKISPNIFANAGPPCCSGKCPENKMTCGKMQETLEKFNKIKQA